MEIEEDAAGRARSDGPDRALDAEDDVEIVDIACSVDDPSAQEDLQEESEHEWLARPLAPYKPAGDRPAVRDGANERHENAVDPAELISRFIDSVDAGNHRGTRSGSRSSGATAKTVSDKQRSANRENAKQSTGPRTAAGKERVAQNALKHGAWSRGIPCITDGPLAEDPEEVRLRIDAVVSDLAGTDHGALAEAAHAIAMDMTVRDRLDRSESIAIRGLAAADAADGQPVNDQRAANGILNRLEKTIAIRLRASTILEKDARSYERLCRLLLAQPDRPGDAD